MITNEDLIELGFKPIPHFTIGNSLTYDLGRYRFLSASSVGTPNEMLFICESNPKDSREITDIITIHNYDYDGYLTKNKVEKLVSLL
jgi:hypothetical protein